MERRRTTVRVARPEDAAALGHLMVESWLAAHRGQVPDEAWHARVAEWTPEISARGWSRVLEDLAGAEAPECVLLVAEDDSGILVGLAYGVLDVERGQGEVAALYVAPQHHRRGIGAGLLRAAAVALVDLGADVLRISVLTANLPARQFYAAMGGHEAGQGTTEEDGNVLPSVVYEWPDPSVLARG